jgi:hypothetical protein
VILRIKFVSVSVFPYPKIETDNSVTAVGNQALCEGFHIESKSYTIMKTVVIVCSITIPFVLLRVWSRLSIAKGLGLDDWSVIAAAVCVATTMILEILSKYHNLFHPTSLLTHDSRTGWMG